MHTNNSLLSAHAARKMSTVVGYILRLSGENISTAQTHTEHTTEREVSIASSRKLKNNYL